MSGHRAQALRRTLHLSIDPSPFGYDTSSLSSSSISPSTSARASIGTSFASEDTNDSNWKIFSVLCLYDFQSDDPDHLPFRKSEILDVVKQEESGWWAAMRPAGSQVGWVPSAFVRTLSEEMAERLQGIREELRIYDYEAERLYDAAPTSNFTHLYALDSESEDWVPIVESHREPTLKIISPADFITGRDFGYDKRTTVLPFSPLSPTHNDGRDAYFTDLDIPISPLDRSGHKPRPPPSPLTPMPHPPPIAVKTAPLTSYSKPHPPRRNNSTPPTADFPRRVPDPTSPNTTNSTNSTNSTNRNHRRRPMFVDDRSSLSRLSTLMETKNILDLEVSDHGESLDSFFRSRRSDKVRQLTGDEDAQKYHNAKVAQANLPWYLKPTHAGDEVKLHHDGSVQAGTLEALVERLTLEPLKLSQGIAFQNAFLMTFKSFATADEVFDLLVERYQMDHSAGLNDEEFEEWKEWKLRPTQKRVLTVLTTWFENHRMLQDDPHIVPRLQEFLSLIVAPEQLAATAKLMIQSLERLSSPVRSVSVLSMSTPSKRKKSKMHKNELLRMDPTEIAQHLCLLEHNLYSKIRPQECLDWVKSQVGPAVTNLAAFCATNDKLAAWVKTSILDTDVLGKRADTVDFWIKVAEKCRSFNNLSSLSALVAALSSAVISRLHLTWAHVGRSSHLEPLVKLIEPTGNFAAYRSILRSVDGPCVPFIGMYLSDIVHGGDQHPDTVTVPASDTSPGYTLIHFVKRQKWYETIFTMLRFQSKPYAFGQDSSTMNFIENHLTRAAGKDHGSFWIKSQEVQSSELAHADIRKGLEAAGF